ncbi:hypothetical protein SSPS47_00285 [Streptomyces sp. S4.7]|nr:hypothetical protein SSPS47_00285 [Streptomyces sp. S4.7]
MVSGTMPRMLGAATAAYSVAIWGALCAAAAGHVGHMS